VQCGVSSKFECDSSEELGDVRLVGQFAPCLGLQHKVLFTLSFYLKLNVKPCPAKHFSPQRASSRLSVLFSKLGIALLFLYVLNAACMTRIQTPCPFFCSECSVLD